MSVYVTDTHPLIYYFTQTHSKLSRRTLRTFEQAERGEAFIYVPAVVLWEVSILEKNGEIRLNEPYEDWASACRLMNEWWLKRMPTDSIATFSILLSWLLPKCSICR